MQGLDYLRTQECRSCQGTILVEMAFVLPIFAIIFVGIIDIGLVIREYQLLQNAAREGAHFSALNQNNQMYISTTPCTVKLAIQNYVVNYAQQENITLTTDDVDVTQVYPVPGSSGSQVTVTHIPTLLIGGGGILNLTSVVLHGTSVFANLYPAAPADLPSGTSCP